MKKIDLCPFCGGYAKLRKFGPAGYAVRCNQCGATGRIEYKKPWHASPSVTQNLAIGDWNKRYNPGGIK